MEGVGRNDGTVTPETSTSGSLASRDFVAIGLALPSETVLGSFTWHCSSANREDLDLIVQNANLQYYCRLVLKSQLLSRLLVFTPWVLSLSSMSKRQRKPGSLKDLSDKDQNMKMCPEEHLPVSGTYACLITVVF